MLRRPPHRWIAFVLVLALSAGSALPAWASYVIPVPGHHFTVAAPDLVEYHDCEGSCEACDRTHRAATVTHYDCVICFGLALPVDLLQSLESPAGFEVGHQVDGAGVLLPLDPHPPRSLSHRI